MEKNRVLGLGMKTPDDHTNEAIDLESLTPTDPPLAVSGAWLSYQKRLAFPNFKCQRYTHGQMLQKRAHYPHAPCPMLPKP